MKISRIALTSGDESVILDKANTIGVSASPETEREKGRSRLRLLISGEEASGKEPFNTLTVWYEEGKTFTLTSDEEVKLEDCSLRECDWNPSQGHLYVGIYSKEPAQVLKLQFPH